MHGMIHPNHFCGLPPPQPSKNPQKYFELDLTEVQNVPTQVAGPGLQNMASSLNQGSQICSK